MAEVLLALGGNVGDVRATLDRALERLCDGTLVRLIKRSSFYRTPPWGVADQPAFINMCAAVETTLPPKAVLELVHYVEWMHGRDRAKEQRWGPRTLDIDILSYDDLALDEGYLILPHPRLFERAFVLVPLAEIAGERVIGGRRVREVAAEIDATGIERLG